MIILSVWKSGKYFGVSTSFVLINGITGHGNVSRGVQEILELLNTVEIHPKNMSEFIRHQRKQSLKFCKIVFLREEKFRSRRGRGGILRGLKRIIDFYK